MKTPENMEERTKAFIAGETILPTESVTDETNIVTYKEIEGVGYITFAFAYDVLGLNWPEVGLNVEKFLSDDDPALLQTEVHYIRADDRFPGKEGNIWIVLPYGLEKLRDICVSEPSIRTPANIDKRVEAFNNGLDVPEVIWADEPVIDDVEREAEVIAERETEGIKKELETTIR
jgi:hypothetical protein